MSELRRLHLRVLYTINSSSYILARSPGPVPVASINDTTETEPYGSVSFKTCLEAICRSSPELVQDRSRDFSVYVLDPLESNAAPAPMDISNPANGRSQDVTSNSSAEQSRGVAVGMGLMSWALSMEGKDPTMVVGTLGKTGTGQDAIEVIVALRETACIDRTRLSSSTGARETPQHYGHNQMSTSTPSGPAPHVHQNHTSETLATIASIQMRTKAKNKPKKPSRTSSTPMTESDKLLSADTYIGPVKKKGRPKGGSVMDIKIKQEESGPSLSQKSSGPPPAPVASFCIGTSTTTTTIQSTTNTSSSPSQTSDLNALSATGGLDLAALAALFSANQAETTQNAFLLNTLNLIDSPVSQNGSQRPANMALVEALGQLLKNAYAAAQLQPIPAAATVPSTTQPSTQPTQTASSREADIVLLDKENINPLAFKRCAEQDHEQKKLIGNEPRASNTGSRLMTVSQTERQVPQSRGLGARSIENSPPKIQSTAPGSLGTTSMLRKRTLDDCMEERDNKRNKNHRGKGKERERSDRESSRFLLNQQQSHVSGLRHYPRILASTLPRSETRTNYYRTGVDAWTSPPRPVKQRNAIPPSQPSSPLGGTSPNRPIVIPDSPQAPRVSASSPIKPTNGHKKIYVVPSWARTNTATQPRLSEEALRAAEAAAEKKKEERRANRRKTNAAAQERSRRRGRMVNSEGANVPSSEPSEPSKCMRPPPQPIIPKSDLPPIVASSDAGPIFFPSPNRRLQSPSPTPRSHLPPPVTPKQPPRVASSTPSTSEHGRESLFTPISIARRSGGTGSPLFSPGILGSPLAQKRPRIPSQTSYRSVGKHLGSESSTTTVKVTGNSEDSPNKSKSPTHDELDEALDDLDCPPSSLPIASSDIEIDDTTTQDLTDTDETEDNQDDEDPFPRKQHWIGLPPSSPPPPTSPGLMPVDDDLDIPGGGIDDEELPIASENDEPEGEFQDRELPENGWAPGPVDPNGLAAPVPDNPPVDFNIDQETVDELAFFEQFTAIGNSDRLLDLPENQQEDSKPTGSDLNSLFPGSFDNMDLNGFLETFRPLIHQDDPAVDTADSNSIFDFCNVDYMKDASLLPQPVDHAKLAEDLQTLLSGCLV